MIKTSKDLCFYLNEDMERNKLKGRLHYYARLFAGFENACAFRYIKCMRKCEYHYNNRNNPFHFVCYGYYRLRLQQLGRKYNLRITMNTCGYGLRLIHIAGGVILNAKRIGNYCGFNSGVVIGNSGKDNCPVIGDYVAFGPGAKAFGNVTIENNCFIAPNAVITKDVSKNSIMGGIPAKFIKEKEPRKNK